MSILVVDACVAIKWFLPEPNSIQAIHLISAGHDLLAPDLIIPECGNVLWKRWRRGELEPAVIPMILRDLCRMDLRIVPTSALIEEAAKIAVDCHRSFYVSVYLALAWLSAGRLVTSDEKLRNALQDTSLANRVLMLEEAEQSRIDLSETGPSIMPKKP